MNDESLISSLMKMHRLQQIPTKWQWTLGPCFYVFWSEVFKLNLYIDKWIESKHLAKQHRRQWHFPFRTTTQCGALVGPVIIPLLSFVGTEHSGTSAWNQSVKASFSGSKCFLDCLLLIKAPRKKSRHPLDSLIFSRPWWAQYVEEVC